MKYAAAGTSGQRGFTFVELVLVIGIFSILLSFVLVNLSNTKHRVSLDTSITSLVTDIKLQQVKAMSGDTDGGVNADQYGLHFQQNDYVLFRGTSFSPVDTANITIPLGENIEITSTSFPNADLVFTRQTGEIVGASGSYTIIIRNTVRDQQKTIGVNKYGVITAIN
ncbi:MAG: type II secretion system protein [Candidatus Levybacteria bacterium]|nr:type II secretion system protein [Candidatus Levybacteria bacterium]